MTTAGPRSKARPTPAILSETVLPSRIVAITTAGGRHRLATLFQPSPALDGLSPWKALRSVLAARGHDIAAHLPRTR
jgi:hypothetical protein